MEVSQQYVTKTRIGVLAVSMIGMAALAITPSYAAIAQHFALNNTSVQMLTSLPNLFMMVAGLIIGKLTASKINLKNLTIGSILLVVIGGLLPVFFHESFAFLIICSCLVGLGQGACTNLTQVLISQILPKKERESTMGISTTFINIGGVVFIMGGGQLAAASSWVNNYWIYLFSLLILLVVILLLPLHPKDVSGNTSQNQEPGKIKLNKYVFYCASWAFLTMLLNNVLNNNISLFVVEQHLGATSQAALTSTISLIGGMLCGLIVGIIGKKFRYSSIALSFLLYGIAYLLIGFIHSLIIVFIGSFLVGAAMSIAMGQFPYLISLAVDDSSVSMALGVYVAIYSVGGVVSPFVVNPLTAMVKNIGINVFSVSGILAIIISCCCLLFKFQKNLIKNSCN
ncbi:MFS transporter [Lactobacillus sp. ESL0677]|uniref:MFS transporter n=1 Tax=Lactobacillus sp. ESL0677 TaxID=2983208 RepID=UPI0023F7E450|nr:MFS transporter [Lactobacillus sp. ESL0677]WEV36582.1 MFS transporter [Lactobacillus sp. ESL0677]